jgi:hypothetical protein
MTWTARTDVGPNERCFVGTNKGGKTFGYVQEYPDKSAAYWPELMAPAKQSPSLDAAKKSAAERALPLRVVTTDDEGQMHGNGSKPTDTFEESVSLASAVLSNIRSRGGLVNIGHPEVPANIDHKAVRVQIIANDDTVLFDRTP